MTEMLKTVEIKVTRIEPVRGLLLALAGEFDQLPPNTKIRLTPLMDDLQKECDEKLQAKQDVKSKLYPGAVVMLASGSAQMTVIDTDGNSARCAYWNDAEYCISYTTTIPAECLILVG